MYGATFYPGIYFMMYMFFAVIISPILVLILVGINRFFITIGVKKYAIYQCNPLQTSLPLNTLEFFFFSEIILKFKMCVCNKHHKKEAMAADIDLDPP